MKHHASRSLGVVFLAALAAVPALHAAEDPTTGPGPAPGLEIFDDAAQIRQPSRYNEQGGSVPNPYAPSADQPGQSGQAGLPDQIGEPFAADDGSGAQSDAALDAARNDRMREGIREDYLSAPGLTPRSSQPPYQPPRLRRVAPTPPPAPEFPETDGQAAGGTMSAYDDPFAGIGDAPGVPPQGYDQGHDQGDNQEYDQRYDQGHDPGYGGNYDQGQGFGPAQPPAGEFIPPPDPLAVMLENINLTNPYFPGLAEASAAGDAQGLGNIILPVLRQRRVVDATMERGIRGSVGLSSPYDFQRLADAANYMPQGAEDPLAPAHRINIILDSLGQPMIDDPLFAGVMPQLLVRLANDIRSVRNAMLAGGIADNAAFTGDEAVRLELARTYVRAAADCDYFAFPRRQLADDISVIMNRDYAMFAPDGSSRGGDTGGITGNLFQILLMMDHHSRNDSWFRRFDLGSMRRTLEKPGQFLLDTARPDKTAPLFGPRGTRELLPVELDALESLLPPRRRVVQRIGLAASNSFPRASNVDSYAGVYVERERDIRDPLGRYLAVRFGPRGDLRGVPSHSDFGALDLMSRGGRFLTDAGGYGGVAASAAAHGGVSIDGAFAVDSTYAAPGMPADAVWRTNSSIDYALGQAGFADAKTWQRGVLYVKNLPGETRTDYWVILDHVNMRGDPNPHNIAVRYQAAPGVTAYHDGPGVMLSNNGTTMGAGVRLFAVDAGTRIDVTDGAFTTGAPGAVGDVSRGQVFDASGSSLPVPSVVLTRRLVGDSTTSTVIYPSDDINHRPVRIERDSDIIRGRTGALVIDHGMGRMDVIAWAPPGSELVTPTLNLQLAADLAVFRIRRGKIARVDFVNLERFQAKEPDGGLWSMRVNGPAQSLTIEPEQGGGWQILADPANRGSASIYDVNLGPAVARSKFSIKPGEMRVLYR